MNTRTSDKIYLIEHDEQQIIGSKLPSKGQVLRVLFHNMRKVKLDLRSSAHLVIKEVEVIWDKARIPTRKVDRSIQKVEELYQEWKVLQKTCKRRSNLQHKRESDFIEELDDLFDIAHGDAMSIIKIEEDRIFLINQRKKGRLGAMVGSDRVLLEKEKRKERFEENVRLRKEKYQLQALQPVSVSPASSDDETPTTDIGTDELDRNTPPILHGKRKRGMHHFISAKLVTTLDKCKVSDRDAVRILIATAEALGHDVSQLVISKTSIRLCRTEMRSASARALINEFKEKQHMPLTLHWDGKILPSLTGKEKVDRLPVVVTSPESEQLLGIPALKSGTGKHQAEAIYELLEEWNLSSKIQALCFDTTATNTGRLQGTCILLEQKFERDLLYLPCRHHVYEIILRSVFEKINLQLSGPTLSIFQRFKASWTSINKDNFKFGIVDERIMMEISCDELEQLVKFSKDYIKKQQPRADYKELLELLMIYLGQPISDFKFKSPGACHHARWMAKAIYCLKIFLFRNEFPMSLIELEAIREASLFIVKIYIKPWIEAPIASKAPNQDLQFIKKLVDYQKVNECISNETLRKFSNHLWYLSTEAVGFSFFDATIACETKVRMINRLSIDSKQDNKKLITDVQDLYSKYIDDFVSKNTLKFFDRFSIPKDFLKKDPSQWDNDSSYKIGVNIVNNMNVVNDTAERNVKLMEEFNNILSKNEIEKQFILQTVTDYRKQYKSTNKCDLAS